MDGAVWGQWQYGGKAHLYEPGKRKSVCGTTIRPFRCGQEPVTLPACAMCTRIAKKGTKEAT